MGGSGNSCPKEKIMPITQAAKFGYSLLLSQVVVDFITTYRLQPGAVYETHGPVIGPPGTWVRASQETILLLKTQVEHDITLPPDVKVLAENLLDSASQPPPPGQGLPGNEDAVGGTPPG